MPDLNKNLSHAAFSHANAMLSLWEVSQLSLSKKEYNVSQYHQHQAR